MDTSNIRGTGAVYIGKETVDNRQQATLVKQPLIAPLDDGQAINNARLEQQKLVIGNQEVFERADSFKQSTSYDDSPSLRIRKELELYQSIRSQEKREDITQLLGVDLYA
ncbi:MAG: hypothetical protein ACI97K_000002 [Glaciecola sp.]|jgi:hypothetical protein